MDEQEIAQKLMRLIYDMRQRSESRGRKKKTMNSRDMMILHGILHLNPEGMIKMSQIKDYFHVSPAAVSYTHLFQAAITNARCFLAIQQEYGTFLTFIQTILPPEPIQLRTCPHPATTVWSDAVAKQMKQQGMRFLGSVTVQAFLEAAGFIDGHEADCFRAE